MDQIDEFAASSLIVRQAARGVALPIYVVRQAAQQ